MRAVQTLSPMDGSPVPAPDCMRCHAIGAGVETGARQAFPQGNFPACRWQGPGAGRARGALPACVQFP